jgi:Tfp pilus assembly protein PilO
MSARRSPVERAWLAGGVIAVGLVLAVGWLLVVRPEQSRASDKQDTAAAAELSNLALQRQVTALQVQSRQLDGLTGQLAAAYQALPASSDMDAFTRELSAAAAASGVRLTSIAVGTPTATDSATGSTASDGQQSRSITVTVGSSGSVTAQQDFLHRIEDGSRAATLTSVGLVSTAGSNETVTIGLKVFVQPQTAQQAAAAKQLLAAGRK